MIRAKRFAPRWSVRVGPPCIIVVHEWVERTQEEAEYWVMPWCLRNVLRVKAYVALRRTGLPIREATELVKDDVAGHEGVQL